MAALRINLRILWNLIMKNFQVKHGQCDSILFLKTFSLENPKKLLLNLFIADSRILYFWQVLESTLNFIIEFHVLYYLFVKGSNKKQRGSKIVSNFTKGETFSSLTYINQVKLLKCGPPSCTLPKKFFLSPSVWARREYIWKLDWKKS